MRKILLVALSSLAAVSVSAQSGQSTFTRGQITYRQIAPTKVEVVSANTASSTATTNAFVVPETVDSAGVTYTVTAIGAGAFKYKTISSLTLPETIDTIRANAFKYSDCRAPFVAPKSLRYIGDGAFKDSHFTSFALNTGLRYIGKQAFEYISSDITSFVVPEGVEFIGESAFFGDFSLTSILLPSTLKKISKDSFYKCGITSITLPSSLDTIPEKAFYNCLNLSEVKFAEGTRYIGPYAFWKCGELKSLSLPPTIHTIDKGAFMQTGLRSFTVPKGTERIGDLFLAGDSIETLAVDPGNPHFVIKDGALYTSDLSLLHAVPIKGVTSFAVAPGCTEIAGGAFYASRATNVTLPEGLLFIDDYAFYNSQVATVDFPKSLLWLGEYCYAYTKLTALTLPSNLYYVPEGAFEGCQRLASVVFPSSVYGIDNKAFANCAVIVARCLGSYAPTIIDYDEDYDSPFYDKAGYSRTLTVPSGCSDSYYDALWDSFFSIVESDEGVVVCNATTPADGTVMEQTKMDISFSLTFDDNVTVANPSPEAQLRVEGVVTDTFVKPLAGWKALATSANTIELKGVRADGSTDSFDMTPGYDYYLVLPDSVVSNANGEPNEQVIIKFTCSALAGVSAPEAATEAVVTGVYDIQGRRLGRAPKGVSIVKYADGSARKVILR